MKFSDIVIAVASIAVIFALITVPLDLVFVSALGLEWGYVVSVFVSLFLSALISGYIFAGKIWEARREAITKITVLWAPLLMLLATIFNATQADWGLKAKEAYEGQYGTTLSTAEWLNWEMMYLDIVVFISLVMALVSGFIGLYIGSILRKPKKS